MRRGIFGGSFDPIHFGHLLPVERARRELGLERVDYLPTARPPHKADRRFAPALARYAMVELALLEREGLYASDLELDASRPTYTIDTLERLRTLAPGDDLQLIIGADSFADLPTWVRWREILVAARLAVLTRPGFRREELLAAAPPELVAAAAAGRVAWIDNPPLELSSTELRRRLAAGEPIPAGWVPERVLTYVAKYRLYR
ncbi:MAG: nicotinate-nucleotide adenylyltransferase [Thermoanaerobaculia bacterium]